MFVLNNFNKWLLANTIQLYVPIENNLLHCHKLSQEILKKKSIINRRNGKFEFKHKDQTYISVQRYHLENKNQILRPKQFCKSCKLQTNDYTAVLKIENREFFAEIISIDYQINQNQTQIQCHYYEGKIVKTLFDFVHIVTFNSNIKHTDAKNIDRKVVSFDIVSCYFQEKRLILEYY
jgi:hypothetical protein